MPTRRGGEAGTNYQGLAVGKGARGPTIIANVFVFLGTMIICRLYKLTPSDRYQITVKLRVPFRFIVKHFSRSAHAGGLEPAPDGHVQLSKLLPLPAN